MSQQHNREGLRWIQCPAREAMQHPSPSRAPRILVVEDEQIVADDIRETLEFLGYEVAAVVTTGEDSIAHLEGGKPDLVLMDIRLAGVLDGVEASEEIQSRFQVPVVYLTANADRTTLDRAKATQPFGYILKPFDDKTLTTTIEIALSRYQAESTIRQALSEAESGKQLAESQCEQQSQYLSIASHEFRNPLATIKIATEVLQRYGEKLSEDRKCRHLQRIQSATDSLNYLLEDMLTLERASSGKFQCEPKWIDVVSFCQEQVEALQFSAGNRYHLQLFIAGEYTYACLDEKLLWHLLNNLLCNAIKYSPNGGTISLTLAGDETNVTFQVRDQGIGIPSESQERLFEPFYRASNVGMIPGTGLGLAIVKQCIEMHDGQITVESVAGQGTTFTVMLPRNS